MTHQASNPPLQLSVVLATYSRADVLLRNLECLARQTLPAEAFEVIVVDDGSPDRTEAVCREFVSRAPYKLTYLRHDNQGPGFTQNRGIREAKAPLILLIADDILLEGGALEAHLAAHSRYGDRRVAVLGNVRQSPELPATTFQRKWDPFELGRLPAHEELPYSMFWACNISIDRTFMLECGMFNEQRGPAGAAAHEDVEVGHRLSRHGLRLVHEPAALGYHFHPETLETAIARSYQRGQNWDAAFKRMPNPELVVRQRLHGFRTLIALRRALSERRRHFLPGDRDVGRLMVELAFRTLLFNRLTVPAFWLPLLNAAERHQALAAWMHPRFYRGVIVHYFRQGYRDALRNNVQTVPLTADGGSGGALGGGPAHG
jgi:glycosyltransferase involved in cell wall biosynthesis